MFIVTVFCEPRNDVTIGPVDLQSVRVLVVNMILWASGTMSGEHRKITTTYINGHLVHMNTLFDAKLRDKNIESRIQNPNDLCLTNDGSITRS